MPSSALRRSPARLALIASRFYTVKSASLADRAHTDAQLDAAILAESIARDERANAYWLATHDSATCTALVLVAA